jgi:primosomal protein N' (replication factor Y)
MQALLEEIAGGHARILVGTQMLAKGHHFPEITLVGVLDADAGLFSTDFRAGERMAQLIIQVAGRAGRAERPGEVLLQTRHPEHPLLQRLIRDGYPGFVEVALAERRAAGLPPYASLALLRAEATGSLEPALEFLQRVAAAARAVAVPGAEALGPVSAPMERRAGRYRAQLLLQSRRRSRLQALLGALLPQIEGLPSARRVRWSLDVDPLEMF